MKKTKKVFGAKALTQVTGAQLQAVQGGLDGTRQKTIQTIGGSTTSSNG
jgi:hypothetical protein